MPRLRATSLGMHTVLALCALVVIFPVAWIAVAAFKTQIALLTGKVLFEPTWANFDELLFSRSSDYFANFLNSLGVASASTLLVAVFSTLAAYSLHRLRWPAWVPATVLLWSVVFHMLPPITMVGPWYVMFRSVGLDNTYTCLILANLALNLTAKQTATVPVAIAKFAQEYEIKHGVMAAGAVLSAIPAIIVLLLAQRHIVKGLTAGAVK